ncbi:hypothetical protein CALVIDRAFT_349522 [Calocera viscosa TUFC12733]|uniref:CHAT domain-containing protein n=1 Tax=Calocera viscosa (strain TUFC12733) TaxID=1330018 RepID=A0A167Q9R2_CALVF|nr:hypothetical protein CALVIDRAFT_349522 [Calocera viscosa TUFC12733]
MLSLETRLNVVTLDDYPSKSYSALAATSPLLAQAEHHLAQFDHLADPASLQGATTTLAPLREQFRLSLLLPPVEILWSLLLCLKYELHGWESDMHDALRSLDRIAPHAHRGAETRIHACYVRGRLFEAEYDASGSLEALKSAQGCYQEGGRLAKQQQQGRMMDELLAHATRIKAHFLANFGYSNAEFPEIDLLDTTAARLAPADPLKAYAMYALSGAYRARWYLHGHPADKADLNRGIACGREALRLCPTHRHRRRMLHELGALIREGRSSPNFHESMELITQAIALIPGDRQRPTSWCDLQIVRALGTHYLGMFVAEGRIQDVDNAIECQRRALAQVGESSGAKRHLLISLAMCLKHRFRATGHAADIDGAIEASTQALAGAEADGPLNVFSHAHLGLAHAYRFIYFGEPEDFTIAQRELQDAIAAGRAKSFMAPQLARCLRTLAHIYRVGVERGKAELIPAMHAYLEEAATLAKSTGLLEMPSIFSELALAKGMKYTAEGKIADLEDCIRAHEAILEVTSDVYAERHLMLWQYALALKTKFDTDVDRQTMDKCLAAFGDAISHLGSSADPRRTFYLIDLAAVLAEKYRVFGDEADLTAAIRHYGLAAHVSDGPVKVRFRAAVLGARLAFDNAQRVASLDLFKAAVGLLSRMAWLGLNTTKRHRNLMSQAFQLAADAAAVAIATGQPETAVELLEEGRSVLWRSVLEVRVDLDGLEMVAPELAKELTQLARTLDLEDFEVSGFSEWYLERNDQQRRRQAERWDVLVDAVRHVPGFELFLKPLDFEHLREAARDGPIVILNTSEYRSDALVIAHTGAVQVVPLTGLPLPVVRQLMHMLHSALQIAKDKYGLCFLERTLQSVARSLWQGGLDEVAKLLVSIPQYAESTRRVWWTPAGLFSLLPIHCAGPYQPGEKGIPELFISSYTTNLSTLIKARKLPQSDPEESPQSSRILAIAQPEAPGMPRLRYARSEIDVLRTSSFKDSVTFLVGREAIMSRAEAVSTHPWLHCVVHGYWNPESPLDSAIWLADGPMTLRQVVKLNLSRTAKFAFLSACHTARATVHLPDEALHMAAGLQVAGFRGVLGTTWGMADMDGPELARGFYENLRGELKAEKAAEALNASLERLRKRGVPMHRWGAFVHYGV